jgi:hypothetical protein
MTFPRWRRASAWTSTPPVCIPAIRFSVVPDRSLSLPGRDWWRGHRFFSPQLHIIPLPPGPILLSSSQSVLFPPLLLPLLFLHLHPSYLICLPLFAFLPFRQPPHLFLLLLFPVECFTLCIVSSCTKCHGHFCELGFFGKRQTMRIG